MSLTSYRAAPPRVGCLIGRGRWCVCVVCMGWVGRPGGDRLSRGLSRSIMGAGGFHGRVRDGIGWITVCHGHQVSQPAPVGVWLGGDWVCVCGGVPAGCLMLACDGAVRRWAGGVCLLYGRAHPVWSSVRAIRTGRLSALLRVHPRPIDVMVYHGPHGDLVLRKVSRLDAFSGYPVRTWLPGRAAGATTGAPEVRPPRSSRTRGSASQVSHTHGR